MWCGVERDVVHHYWAVLWCCCCWSPSRRRERVLHTTEKHTSIQPDPSLLSLGNMVSKETMNRKRLIPHLCTIADSAKYDRVEPPETDAHILIELIRIFQTLHNFQFHFRSFQITHKRELRVESWGFCSRKVSIPNNLSSPTRRRSNRRRWLNWRLRQELSDFLGNIKYK